MPEKQAGGVHLTPAVLTDVNYNNSIMKEESLDLSCQLSKFKA